MVTLARKLSLPKSGKRNPADCILEIESLAGLPLWCSCRHGLNMLPEKTLIRRDERKTTTAQSRDEKRTIITRIDKGLLGTI